MAPRCSHSPGRRVFVRRLAFVGGGVLLWSAGCKCAKETQGPTSPPAALTSGRRTFTEPEWAVVCAVVDRLLPKDADPGALEANVPEYLDRMLLSPDLGRMREDFLGGINAVDRRAQRMFAQGFAALTAEQRDEVLTAFKESPPQSGEARFYELLMALTLEGFLGDPSYGGNKDRVGWALVGFATVEPPAGHDGLEVIRKHHSHGGH
jgi:gluconate 2-dehydrogenase gamma chain